MASKINLKLCRMCHQHGVIDLKNDKSGDLLKKVNSVVSYKLELKPELSSLICRDCFKEVTTAYNFQMKCLRHELLLRKRAKLGTAEIKVASYSTDINETNTASMHQSLSDSGLQVMRHNIKLLNDKIAVLKQDKSLLEDKVSGLENERDELKRTVMQFTLTLPDITTSLASLLSRMEQQFVNMNTRVIPDNYVETRARSPIVAISVNPKLGAQSLSLDDQMDVCDAQEDDDDEEELLLKHNTTILEPNVVNSNCFTVLVARRPIA